MSARRAVLLGAALAGLVAGVLPVRAQRAPRRPEEMRRPVVDVAVLRLRGAGEAERAAAVPGLLAAVARRTSVVTVTASPPEVAPTDAELFDHPLVLLAGHRAFEPLDDDEIDALRSYLALGGMILVDDTSGRADSEFGRRARAELSRAVGGREFRPIPSDHAVFRAYYLLDRAWGGRDVSEELQALFLDGRAAVIFSANDVSGAWERDAMGQWAHAVSPGGRRQRELAIRLGVNFVLYALTLDYKEDLVHLPLILERRR